MSSFIILILFGMAVALFSSWVKSKKEEKKKLLDDEKENKLADRIAKKVIDGLKSVEVGPEIIDFGSTSDE